jgi:4-hydroxybenzoate polyprenyltransferase
MRPSQWMKNVFIFAGLIYSKNLYDLSLLVKVTTGFVLFSIIASSIYLFNDIKDREKDKAHPEKCNRPLAAGQLTVQSAYVASSSLALIGLACSFLLDTTFFLVVLCYFLMNIVYSTKIKDMVILDVMFIAFGFVLRVIAGTVLAGVRPSDWLVLCTIMLSLYLGFSKRRHELAIMDTDASNHRKVLEEYNITFLDQMISVATACTVLSYSLYTIAEETVARFGTKNLVFTIPFVIYGVYRYLYLIHGKKMGGNPTSLVLNDYPLLLDIIGWIATTMFIIYFFPLF